MEGMLLHPLFLFSSCLKMRAGSCKLVAGSGESQRGSVNSGGDGRDGCSMNGRGLGSWRAGSAKKCNLEYF